MTVCWGIGLSVWSSQRSGWFGIGRVRLLLQSQVLLISPSGNKTAGSFCAAVFVYTRILVKSLVSLCCLGESPNFSDLLIECLHWTLKVSLSCRTEADRRVCVWSVRQLNEGRNKSGLIQSDVCVDVGALQSSRCVCVCAFRRWVSICVNVLQCAYPLHCPPPSVCLCARMIVVMWLVCSNE